MAFNRKAMEMNFQLVSILLVLALLVFASFAFVPDTIDTVKEFFEGLGFGFEEQTVPDQIIDEERIDEGTNIPISSLSYDSKSGNMFIVKDKYGQGWGLYGISYGGTEYQTAAGTRGIEKEETLIEQQQTLEAILTSQNLRGTILIDNTVYIHSSYENNAGWFQEKEDGDRKYQSGEEITTENLNKIILADLYTQATEE